MQLDEMIRLYKDELLSFEEIGQRLGIDWWIIKELFKKHGIPRFTLKQRAELKRKKDFPVIFELHKYRKMSLRQIYELHGYSPAYSRLVLRENTPESTDVLL